MEPEERAEAAAVPAEPNRKRFLYLRHLQNPHRSHQQPAKAAMDLRRWGAEIKIVDYYTRRGGSHKLPRLCVLQGRKL